MAGLINDNAAQQPAAQQPPDDNTGDKPAAGGKISADQIRGKIQVPQELQGAYQRVVVAGGKFMFDERTHELALKQFKESKGDIGNRLGVAIAGLLVMLWQQSNKTIPPQVILPAAMDLLGQAAQFVQDSKMEPITSKDVAKATSIMIALLTKAFGGDPSKFAEQTGVKADLDQMQQDMQANGPGGGGGQPPGGPPDDEGQAPEPTQADWDAEAAQRNQQGA